ncbi:MAG: DUF2867 domain-containing protein [Lentisphaerae bacterium]|nr:DUF2867 domain-containing protein [Lentisphaerota bacterium]
MTEYQHDVFCDDLPTRPQPEIGKILVTGATGYIGGRLVPELLIRGYNVRVMVRAASPEHQERWPEAEIAVADALDRDALERALDGVHTAYYLIHSLLLGPGGFEEAELKSAGNFAKAAETAGVHRIIYLGGLGDMGKSLSPHLQSRMQVAQTLDRGAVQTTILRAAIIIGSGSASYEIVKHLVEKLPVFFIPPWGRTRCQPIGIRDVVKYLVGVLETPETCGASFDIGGKGILSYEMMMRELADVLGKKRLFINTFFSRLGFYAYLASLITPVPASITFCLMEGLRDDVICQNGDIRKLIPFRCLTYRESLVDAMSREEQDRVHTRWSDAYPPAHELAIKLHELDHPPAYTCIYSLQTTKSAPALFRSICRIGGKEGWFHVNWMWRLRGMLDRVLAGVGSSRGRRSSSTLRINDVIDFWRVEDLLPDEMLLLRAEMKLPGRGWLEFRVQPDGERRRLCVQSYYDTNSVAGRLYWYIFLPFHFYIFSFLLKQIEKRS